MNDKEIISNWIKAQNGFFIGSMEHICPICNQPKSQVVLTKKSGMCMPCFIEQIVNVCKKQENQNE